MCMSGYLCQECNKQFESVTASHTTFAASCVHVYLSGVFFNIKHFVEFPPPPLLLINSYSVQHVGTIFISGSFSNKYDFVKK